MNHQTRRDPTPAECPLASLGRDTPTLDRQSYHYSLSSSPLDSQIYEMSEKSANLSTDNDNNDENHIIFSPSTSILHHKPIADSDRLHSTKKTYHLSTSSSSSIEHPSTTSSLHDFKKNLENISRHVVINQTANASTIRESPGLFSILSKQRHHRQPPPLTRSLNTPPINSNILPLYKTHQPLSLVNGHHHQPSTSRYFGNDCRNQKDNSSDGGGEDNGDDDDDDDDDVVVDEQEDLILNDKLDRRQNLCNTSETSSEMMISVNHHNECFLNDKINSLYIQSAIHQTSGHHNKNGEFYLEENNCYNYNEPTDRLNDSFDNHMTHRRSNLNDQTNGSDHHFIINQQNGNSLTFMNESHYANMSGGNLSKRIHSGKHQCLTSTDGLSNLGRLSPSFDQGYATLVSPSPSSHQIPDVWNKNESPSSCYRTSNSCSAVTSAIVTATSSNSKIAYFDSLPDEIVLRIFSWLSTYELCKLARVCRRFESLAWKPNLWRIITLTGEHVCGDKALKMIFRRLCGQTRNGTCPDMERVMLSDGCRLTDKGLQLLSRRCPELTHLQIQSSLNVSNQALCDVLTKCSNLQHLDITGCVQICTLSVHPNLDPSRRLLLQYLDLTDCTAIDDIGLKITVKNCPQLTYLYLRRCIQITDAGLKFIPSFCLTLKELSVSDCLNITDFGLYELAKLGAALRYLSVAKCDRVSDAGLKVIARRCYKLRYLNVRGCEAVSDDSITILARSCPRLRALDIGKCDISDTGLRALAESCPNLKKLSLRNCDMITDRGVQCIAYYCRGLQQLNIQDCQISIEGYRSVKKYCKRCVIEHTNPGFY